MTPTAIGCARNDSIRTDVLMSMMDRGAAGSHGRSSAVCRLTSALVRAEPAAPLPYEPPVRTMVRGRNP